MKNMKKFGALALATVVVASAVYFVTPALKAAAEETARYNYENGGYVSAADGAYILKDGEYVKADQSTDAAGGTTGDTTTTTTVTGTPVGFSLVESGAGMFVGDYYYIGVNYDKPSDPSTAIWPQITYKSADTSIATVNIYDGFIYGVKAGTTKITVTATYEGLPASTTTSKEFEIRVYNHGVKTVVNATSSSSSSSAAVAAATAEILLPTTNGLAIRQFEVAGVEDVLLASPEGVVPSGSKVTAEEATVDSQTFAVASEILAIRVPGATLAKVFDFNVALKDGTLLHQLDGTVAMSFPIPADLVVPEGYVPVMYRFNDDGTVTRLETIIADGNIVFGTDHFSTFGLVVEKAPKAAKTK